MSAPTPLTTPEHLWQQQPNAAEPHEYASWAGYVERLGVALQPAAESLSAGRLLGWLLTCEPAAQSIRQLSLALSTTPSTLGGDVEVLRQAGYLETLNAPRPPGPLHQVRPDAWRAALALPQRYAAERRVLIEEGLALLEHTTPQRRQRLMSMHQVFAFAEAHYLSATKAPSASLASVDLGRPGLG